MKPALTHDQMLKALPEMCMSRLPSDNTPILIKRGHDGYRPYNKDPDEFNRVVGVTPAQREAMVAGSMFGWDVPGANPENYDENGRPYSSSRKRQREAAFMGAREAADVFGTDEADEQQAIDDKCARAHE